MMHWRQCQFMDTTRVCFNNQQGKYEQANKEYDLFMRIFVMIPIVDVLLKCARNLIVALLDIFFCSQFCPPDSSGNTAEHL